MVDVSSLGGNSKFAAAADKALDVIMSRGAVYDGLFPMHLNLRSPEHMTAFTGVGAFSDSFYEYLLKLWLWSGKTDNAMRQAYDAAVEGIRKRLVTWSMPSGLAYLADFNGTHAATTMHHLTCFVPGMLALGAVTAVPGSVGAERAEQDMQLAAELMETCWLMFHKQPTGLSPDQVEFSTGGTDGADQDFVVAGGSEAHAYVLRPEIAESLYVMFQSTGNETYKEWAWELFRGIEKHCRVEGGYGAHSNVTDVKAGVEDSMESFFLAETLKYLYLTFGTDDGLLREFVFNTEAHPFDIPQRSTGKK